MHAVRKHAILLMTHALMMYCDMSVRRLGANTPINARTMPDDANPANPHKAYVPITSDRSYIEEKNEEI